MSHALADSLAEHLRVARERHIVFRELTLPGIEGEWGAVEGSRADLYAIRPSWGRKDISIYEVKGSRSDFLGDVNSGKYQKYLPHCRRLYFATPRGLVKARELPEQTGLISWSESGWRVVRHAPQRDVAPPSFDFMVALLDRCWFEDLRGVRDLKQRVVWDDTYGGGGLSYRARRMGQEISAKLANAERAEEIVREHVDGRNAVRLVEAVVAAARAMGVEPRWSGGELDAGALTDYAETVAGLLKLGAEVEEMGNRLRRLPRLARERVDALAEPV